MWEERVGLKIRVHRHNIRNPINIFLIRNLGELEINCGCLKMSEHNEVFNIFGELRKVFWGVKLL